MSILMNRRRGMGGAGVTLPYDKQVEYLESTGTQYISLGRVFTTNDIIEFDFQFPSVQSAVVFGTRKSGSAEKLVVGSGTSGTKIYAALGSKANTNIADFDTNRHHVKIDLSTGLVYIDNDTNGVGCGTYVETTYIPLLFGLGGSSVSLLSSARIFNFEASANNVKLLDLIPVRIGQVGYMYNKANGDLLGNDGSDSFILGNDV